MTTALTHSYQLTAEPPSTVATNGREPSLFREPPDAIVVLAQNGNIQARDVLVRWVYEEGSKYFNSQVRREPLLSYAEAQDLAGESLLEFQKAIPRIKKPARYVRRMFRNNLVRHLTRKRARLSRELLGDDFIKNVDFLEFVEADEQVIKNELSDTEKRRIEIANDRLRSSDHVFQQIWSFRLADEPLGYREIGAILGLDDATLRMRVARFCRSVRKECKKREKRQRFMSGLSVLKPASV